MSYIFLAILSHLSWAFVAIGDKYVLVNRVKNPYVYLIWLIAFGITAVLAIPFVNFQIPTLNTFGWQLAASALYFFGGFPYVKAMQEEEATRINFLWALVPLFSMILGWLVIDEILTGRQFLALGILLAGSVVASLHARKFKIRFSKAFWLMMLASFCYAFYAVCMRQVNMELPFVSSFIWHYIIMFGFSLFIVPAIGPLRRAFKNEVKALTAKTAVLVAGVSFMDFFGILLNVWALSLGPAALVYSMEGFQMLFVFAMVIVLSLFFKINLQEELTKKNLLLKSAALILMISGVLILNLTEI